MARALFGSPAIFYLDEPNAHLDINGETRLITTLQELKARGATVIVSTHRTGLLQAVDKVMLLRDGVIQVYDDRANVIRPAPSVDEVREVGQMSGHSDAGGQPRTQGDNS